jgi:hypothetical protein
MRTIRFGTTAMNEASWFGRKTRNKHLIGSRKNTASRRCMRFNKIQEENKMEKFLWNVGGVVLFVVNVWTMMICFASGQRLWGLALIAIAGLDWLYKEKRPTWLEV